MFTPKYESEELALAALIEGKKPDCVDALEKIFWQSRGTGLDIRTSYFKALFDHALQDHSALDHGRELDDDIHTDADVYAYADHTALKAIEEGDDANAVNHQRVLLKEWYDLFRSWGGDVYLSYTSAVVVIEELANENHDANEEETLKRLNEFPIENHRSVLVETFLAHRAKGNTVRASLARAIDEGEKLLLSQMFTLLGGSE